jgi:hypothetical protein
MVAVDSAAAAGEVAAVAAAGSDRIAALQIIDTPWRTFEILGIVRT